MSTNDQLMKNFMDFRETSVIRLRYSPCAFAILDGDITVCGTYQINEDDKEHRVGSLAIFEGSTLVAEEDCQDGGVFDVKTCGSAAILVAHTSGFLTRYRMGKEKPHFQVIGRMKISDKILTSVDCKKIGEKEVVVVGDYQGQLFVLVDDDLKSSISPSSNEYFSPSIWSVYILPIETDYIILAGSDDGSLSVIDSSGKVILKDMSASAGVTNVTANDGLIVSGSYDEHLRVYRFSFHEKKLTLLHTLHIAGSGIWRIRDSPSSTNLLIAGMYSGIHVVEKMNWKVILSKSWLKSEGEPTSEDNQLIYDAIYLPSNSLMVASFYAKAIFFIKIDQLLNK